MHPNRADIHLFSDQDLTRLHETWGHLDLPTPKANLDHVQHPECYRREIGEELGVGRERVRQIEQAALVKCRLWCQARGLRLEDLLSGI